MPYDATTAAQKGQLIKFAYNMYESAPTSLTPGIDAGISAAGYDFLNFLSADDLKDVKFYGYLAASSTSPGDLVLSIRGTETPKEWALDFDVLPLPYLGKGFVAAGFRSIAESIEMRDTSANVVGNLMTVLGKRHASVPITSITVLGHSLGGAIATLAAAQIAFSGTGFSNLVSLWTYASPKVGFPDFVGAFNKAVPSTYRIWNALDVVPQLPLFPYEHVGQSEQLKQTQSQIQQLKVNPACEHHLSTYEWLLDPAHFSLDSDCTLSAVAPAATPVSAYGAVAVTEAAAGAAALANAIQAGE